MKIKNIIAQCGLSFILSPCALALNCSNMQESIGSIGSLFTFPQTSASIFGMNEDLLINDWTFGKQVFSSQADIVKSSFLLRAVANHSYLCYLDPVHGRYQLTEATRLENETQAAYVERISQRILDIKGDFVAADLKLAQKDPSAPLNLFSVSAEDKDFLKANLYKTQDKTLTAYFTRISWVFELLNAYEITKNLLKSKLVTTRKLITNTLTIDPNRVRLILERLKKNTDDVLAKYGDFMGEEQRQRLLAKIESIKDLEKATDMEAFRQPANEWCDEIDAALNRLFQTEKPLAVAGARLRLVYSDTELADLNQFLIAYPEAKRILDALQ